MLTEIGEKLEAMPAAASSHHQAPFLGHKVNHKVVVVRVGVPAQASRRRAVE